MFAVLLKQVIFSKTNLSWNVNIQDCSTSTRYHVLMYILAQNSPWTQLGLESTTYNFCFQRWVVLEKKEKGCGKSEKTECKQNKKLYQPTPSQILQVQCALIYRSTESCPPQQLVWIVSIHSKRNEKEEVSSLLIWQQKINTHFDAKNREKMFYLSYSLYRVQRNCTLILKQLWQTL